MIKDYDSTLAVLAVDRVDELVDGDADAEP